MRLKIYKYKLTNKKDLLSCARVYHSCVKRNVYNWAEQKDSNTD